MSDEESPTSGGQKQANKNDSDANNSIIGIVKSRVSSILPQSLSQWFSPTATGSRNGNMRRKRHDADDDEHQSGTENSDDSDIDIMQNRVVENQSNDFQKPALKRSRFSIDENCTISDLYQNARNQRMVSSTPMATFSGNKNRQNLGLLRSQPASAPYDFTRATTSTFLNSGTLLPSSQIKTPIHRMEQETRYFEEGLGADIVEVVPDRISSRRSLNIPPITRLDQGARSHFSGFSKARSTETSRTSFHSNMIPTKKNRIDDEIEEGQASEEDIDEEDDEILGDEDEDDVILNTEIKIAQKLLQPDSESLSISVNAQQQQELQKYTNGLNRSSRQDTPSESGDSLQSASSHRPKSGLFNPSASSASKRNFNGISFYSHLEGKKSLFSDKNIKSILNNSTMSLNSLHRRQFNSSLYGSTSALSDSRLLNTISPFYKGRTTYGGASAYNRYSQSITPTLIRPTSRLSTASSLNSQDGNTNSGISTTAKRILELMNQFTTPLTDAKKLAHSIQSKSGVSLVANKKRFSELDLLELRQQCHQQPIHLGKARTPYSRPVDQPTKSDKTFLPPTTELQVPSMAQLLQLKKLQNNTEKVRELANTNKNSILNQNEYDLPDGKSKTSHQSKIKQKISTRQQQKQKAELDEMPINVNLPNLSLPFMKSVPKFDIDIQPNKKSGNTNKKSYDGFIATNTSIATVEQLIKKDDANLNTIHSDKQHTKDYSKINNSLEKSNNEFKFSSPISLNQTNNNFSKNLMAKTDLLHQKKFKFSPPTPISLNMNSSISDESQPGNGIISNNNNKNINFTKTTPQLKTSGSVLDALKTSFNSTNSNFSNNTSIGFGDTFKKPNNQWECSICMIRNDEKLSKCAACETARTSNASKPSLILPITDSIKSTFSDTFKPKPGTWECDACMVRNEMDKTSCVACTTLKPNVKSIDSTPVPKLQVDDGFKKLVAQQTNSKWECTACMTRNDMNRSKCICCEQARSNESAEDSEKPKFTFGIPASTNPQFSFGFGAIKEQDVKKDSRIEINSEQTSISNQKLENVQFPPAFNFGFKPNLNKKEDDANSKVISQTDNLSTKPIENNENKTENKSSKVSIPTSKDAMEPTAKVEMTPGGFPLGGTFSLSQSKIKTKEDSNKSLISPEKPFGIPIKKSNEIQEKPMVFGSVSKSGTTGTAPATTPFLFGNQTSSVTTSTTPLFGTKTTSTIASAQLDNGTSIIFGSKPPAMTVPVTKIVEITTNTASTATDTKSKDSSTASKTTSLFGAGSPIQTSAFSNEVFKPNTTENLFGNIKQVEAITTCQPTNTNQTNTVFTFASKSESNNPITTNTSVPVFGSSVSIPSSKPFSFGSSGTISTSSTIAQSSSTSPPTSLFGNNSNNTAGSTTFGQQSAAHITKSPFGQTSSISSPFGQPNPSANTTSFANASSANTTVFGSNITTSFGNNTSSTFGNSNTSIGFGGSNPPAFGAPATNQSTLFGTTNSSFGTNSSGFGSVSQPNYSFSEGSAAKKPAEPAFNFGTTAAPSPQTGNFSFGSNNNNNNNQPKQAFNFSAATTAPSFNFTGAGSDALNPSQPFQFGASGNNVGTRLETSAITPFQFNAATAATNNVFAPTTNPGACPVTRRRVRTGTRRIMQPR